MAFVIFSFFVETGSPYIAQVGLELLSSLKTFFLNQVKSRNEVCLGSRSQIAFCVNRQYQFCIDEKMSRRYRPDRYYAIQNMRSGTRNMIPLWLFGFLY